MFNLWLILREDAKDAINESVSTPDDEYAGVVPERTRDLFRTMSDLTIVQGLFRSRNDGEDDYYIFSVYVENGNAANLTAEVDYMVAQYPGIVVIGGAWNWDGSQAGGYTPHATLIDYMPYTWNPVDELFNVPPVAVTDVNLLAGQSPRDFS